MLRRAVVLAGAGTLLALASPGEASAVIAACRDGSLVLARSWRDVRCAGALEVHPNALARLGSPDRRTALLARAALLRDREVARERDLEGQIRAVERAREAEAEQASEPVQPGLVLAASEHRALAAAIERHQVRARATLLGAPVGAGAPTRLRFAYAPQLEATLRAQRGAGGPVLVFDLEPAQAMLAGAPPRFAQGGTTFRPRTGEPDQLGWIATPAGDAADRARLGYVVLPAEFELDRPLVFFWGDAVAATRLLPAQR